MSRLNETHDSHRWDDVSHHGSPFYQCDFCHVYDHSAEAKLPCPRVEECLKQEAERLEREERVEYERMLSDKIRFEYLESKYGPQNITRRTS